MVDQLTRGYIDCSFLACEPVAELTERGCLALRCGLSTEFLSAISIVCSSSVSSVTVREGIPYPYIHDVRLPFCQRETTRVVEETYEMAGELFSGVVRILTAVRIHDMVGMK